MEKRKISFGLAHGPDQGNNMKKPCVFWVGLIIAVLALFSFSACDSGSSSDDDEISDDVLELADGAMSFIGDLIKLTLSDGTPPSGITISKSGSVATITVTNYSTEPGASSLLNGTITMNASSAPPLVLTISGMLTLTNSDFRTLAIEGSFRWAAGADLDKPDEPEEYSGTMTIDGTSYTFKELLEAGDTD